VLVGGVTMYSATFGLDVSGESLHMWKVWGTHMH